MAKKVDFTSRIVNSHSRKFSGRNALSVLANPRESFKSPEPVARPRNVALIGASERASWPRQIHGLLRNSGFAGKVYPVNPRQTEVWGETCYPDIASLPERVDHALIIVPAPAVLDVLETGVANGLKSCTIYAGNIGEGANPEVIARGVALRALVERTGLVVNGPNCMGGNSLRDRFFGYPNPELLNIPIGHVSCVSQSGGTLQFLVQSAAARGVKFSTMFSSGNEIDLDLADFVNYLVDDEHTRVIALFIEGIRRPAVFMRAAARALAAGKPIVAIKTGKSLKSREASLSHTGAIAGDYEVFTAMCERYGIVACHSLDDMVETLLAFEPCRWPKGNRVGWVTTSGGTVDLLHDYIEEIPVTSAPEFSEATKAAIRHLVPAELAIKNPLDAGIPTTDVNAAEMCIAVANDPNVDILAWAQTLPSGKRSPDIATLKTILAATDKPVIAFARMNYMFPKEGLDFQDAVGYPFLQALPPTIRALGALAFYGARAGRRIDALPAPKGSADNVAGDNLAATLARHGVTSPKSAFATSAAEAAAATRIGFPVALKIVAPDFTHKTEIGGVKLNLKSAADVETAATELATSLRAHAPGAAIDGYLVQEMAAGVEVIVGARNDPLYGPVLLLGAGGVMVELVKDIAFRLLPVGEADVRAMLDELKVSKLLAGWRGAPRADVEALVSAVVGLGAFFLDHRHVIDDIEINPIIVAPAGRGVRAVDIRVVGRQP